MADFNQAFDITMGHEGGYANNPNDSGGETYKGIARKFWPGWPGWPYIDNIKKMYGRDSKTINKYAALNPPLQGLVRSFYKTNFWDVNNLDLVNTQQIANEMFDTGVNMGTSVAAKFLQEALNLCNVSGRAYPELTVDGQIGPVTLNVLNTKANQKRVLNTLNLLQGEKYLNIVRNRESQEEFWGSWLSRVLVS